MSKKAFVAQRLAAAAAGVALACSAAWVHAQGQKNEQGKDPSGLAAAPGTTGPGAGIFQAIETWASRRIGGAAPSAAAPAALPVSLSLPPAVPAPAQPLPWTQSPSYSPAPLILGQPDVPFSAQQGSIDPSRAWDGRLNYQGVTVSAVMLNNQNLATDTRSLAAAFRVGERFKLRIVSTSDAIISLDGLRAPPGMSATNGVLTGQPALIGQVYPPQPEQVVHAKAGEVVHIPLGANAYFTVDDRPGVELLSLHLRHPQAKNNAINRQPIYRQDAQGMTTYVQLVQPGAHLALSQLIPLQQRQ